MQIELKDIAKKFQNEWIFRNISLKFEADQSYTLIGANGSGKSTLLQIIAGILPSSKGNILYKKGNENIKVENIFKYISIATPYQELIEEFTLEEHIKFHLNFKSFQNNLTIKDFVTLLKLEKSLKKPIKYFSSGMKQRLKLGLAFYSDTSILLLDEPTSNLDKQGITWYQKEVLSNSKERLLVLCSNQSYEYEFCKNIIDMMQYK